MGWLENWLDNLLMGGGEGKVMDLSLIEEKIPIDKNLEAGKKRSKEARKENEKEEKAEEGLKHVIDTAKLKCDLCATPQGDLKVNFDTPTIQDKKTATIKEKDMTSLIFKGNCKKSPNSSSPCVSVMQLGDWKDTGTSLIQDQPPLLLKSTIKCNYGGVDIAITDCGQKCEPEEIDVVGVPVPEVEIVESYKCTHCEEEFTAELFRKTIGAEKLSTKQKTIIDSFLPYLNKYRKDFGLDTCLRKAHFVSQIALESASFTTFEEGEEYSSSITLGIFSSSEIVINATIVNSLKDKLNLIFKIVDNKGIEIIKTNDELKTILLNEKPNVIDGELYGKYKGEKDIKDKKKRNDKLLKEVLKADKTIDYKIYLKPHSCFGVPLMSRAYAPYTGDTRGLGNGDELSRDGWKFKGRGLKQVTGRGNYENFAKYRNKNSFNEDTTGQIDFTKEKEGSDLKGNYLKLSDDAMYATQSALWFWNDGTKYNKKLAKEHADKDDVDSVSKAINRYDKKALPKRKANYNRARKEGVFDINRHYKLMLENGDEKQKKEAKEYLEKRKGLKDKEAIKILEDNEKKNPVKKEETKPINK